MREGMREGNFLERKFPLDPLKELLKRSSFFEVLHDVFLRTKQYFFSEEKTGRTPLRGTDLFYLMADARVFYGLGAPDLF